MIGTEADLKNYQHSSDRGGGGVMVRDDDIGTAALRE